MLPLKLTRQQATVTLTAPTVRPGGSSPSGIRSLGPQNLKLLGDTQTPARRPGSDDRTHGSQTRVFHLLALSFITDRVSWRTVPHPAEHRLQAGTAMGLLESF